MVGRVNRPHLQNRKAGRRARALGLGLEPRHVQLLSAGPQHWASGEAREPEEAAVALPLVPLLRYQFNPAFFQTTVTAQILLKALTNLPHTDFTLCKCMIDQAHVSFQRPGAACGGGAGGKVDEVLRRWSASSATNSERLLWAWCAAGWDIWVAGTGLAPALPELTAKRGREVLCQ